MARHGHTCNGVTIRHLRQTICDAIPSDPVLVKAIEDAAGGSFIRSLGKACMTGHGADLHIMYRTYDGRAGRIGLDVQLDSLRGGDISLWDKDKPVVVAQGDARPERWVTMAPACWFQHSGNAASAVNPLILDDLVLVTAPPTRDVIYDGVHRGWDKFRALAKPKRAIPRWVYATR